ncbi:uncharacterized protein LOC128886565 [Hylaeus anthracinus]|uniref:uncharacterized protein LOC128886565 n=1 Tax=Hylaeus anthracinus TaxID=313031 RepID=UPI0023B8E62C|nr:uncharacterized protein LOC128886565 [Hylaeus anthracinus]
MKRLNCILYIIFPFIHSITLVQSEISSALDPVKTSFSCVDRTPGFYADVDAKCKAYHTCDEYGNKFTYRCPEETAFRQDALICDHAHLVKCQGPASLHAEATKEKYTNSSCIKESKDNANCQFLFQSLHEIRPTKMHGARQHGFTFSSQKLRTNYNATEGVERKTIKSSHPSLSPLNSTSIKTHVSSANRNRQSVLKEDGTNQKNYQNQKTNDALYNVLKVSLNSFSGNAQNQQNNMNNHKIRENSQDLMKFSFMNHRNYPYTETLKSIQKSTKMPIRISTPLTTTEVPLYALTLALKPLVPSELEYDPYYPKVSTSTESYYTPSYNDKKWSHTKGSQTLWSNTHIKLPSVLPDLNSLEDIVDRRKQFYIPRISSLLVS